MVATFNNNNKKILSGIQIPLYSNLKSSHVCVNLDAINADIQNRSTSKLLLEDSIRSDVLTKEDDIDGVNVSNRVVLQLLLEFNVGRKKPKKKKLFC